MERIVLQELREWKERPDRKPLVLNGARQVGKTWLLRELARRDYSKEAYVLCRKNTLAKQIFEEDFNVDRIIRALKAITGTDITPHDTLIILDEVQEIPEAMESLKYFNEVAPQYHIAVAGSLLGVSLHQGVSFPVGKVSQVNVYPMNFEEFLLAKGEVEAYKLLVSRDFGTMNMLHGKYVDLLRQYYFVGGMPEAVKKYAESESLADVRRIQNEILSGYDLDFSKHASGEQTQRIRMVWKSVPGQLFKSNKKFIYGALRQGARAREFEVAIQWLLSSGILTKVPNCKKIAAPLSIYEDFSAFKLYMLDVGLLGAMAGVEPSQILVGSGIFTEYKGGMTEQYVLQQLRSHGISPIFYHSAADSRLEIDFLIQEDGEAIPVEVKAGENVRANSLSALLRANPGLRARRYSMKPYVEQGQLTCVPLYAV